MKRHWVFGVYEPDSIAFYFSRPVLLLQENVAKALEKLETMNNALFARLVPSENLVIKTAGLTVALTKVLSKDLNGFNMEDGPAKFKLPSNLGGIEGGDIDAKVRD